MVEPRSLKAVEIQGPGLLGRESRVTFELGKIRKLLGRVYLTTEVEE